METKDTGKETVQNDKDKYNSIFSKLAFLRNKSNSYFNPELDSECVKGRLKKRWKFWEKINANRSILETVKNGYKIPFISNPTYKISNNNKTALDNKEFVSKTLQDLLKSGSVLEVPFVPIVVNPLSVNTRASGKQRLILDLRHVNEFILKEHVKFEDWREFHKLIQPGGFLFKFDLKKGYHHVDIDVEHQLYLGFSWNVNNVKKYFVFTVLPFGLSSAPGLFTKLLRPLISVWHGQGINIAVFLDDGAGVDTEFNKTLQASKMTRELLKDCGFVINEAKSQWYPVQILVWLGIEVDLIQNTYKITQERISSLLSSIEYILKSPYTSARTLCRLAGKIVSMKFVLSNLIRLRTRFLYKAIDKAPTWDGKINILHFKEAHKEILFWKNNIVKFNKRSVIKENYSNIIVYSDASNSGIGALFKENNSIEICHKMFDKDEEKKSSTWRELEAIRFGLESFSEKLSNKSVLWRTDNRAAMFISSSGSGKLDLQKLALVIYDLTCTFNIDLEVSWVSRNQNQAADYLSRLVDPDDWELTSEFVELLENKWGKFSIDRFANFDNAKCERFNSKYTVPGTEAIDAFTQDWRNENNLLVPPVSCLIKVITYIRNTKGIRGVLIAPYWTSSLFWALLQNCGKFASFIQDHMIFTNLENVLCLGKYHQSLLGSNRYKGGIIAMNIKS